MVIWNSILYAKVPYNVVVSYIPVNMVGGQIVFLIVWPPSH